MFDGGLDNIQPQITAAPGTMSACFNFERTDRLGYSRCFGYEKYDGAGNPSLAYTNLVYVVHNTNPGTSPSRSAIWISGTEVVVLGYVVNATATKTLLAITDFDEWRKVLADIPGVVLEDAHGISYDVTNTITFDADYKASFPTATAKDLTNARNGFFINMGNTVTTPGSGTQPTIGLHGYKSQLYSITNLDVLYFTNGNKEPIPGDYLVPSGASTEDNLIIVRDIKLLSGTWAGGDATGLILTNQMEHLAGFAGPWDIKYPTSTSTAAIMLGLPPLNVDATSFKAGLWRTNDYKQAQAASEPEGWVPVDTGYEYKFKNGTAYGPPVTYSRGSFTSQTTPTLTNSAVATVGSTTDSTYGGTPIAGDSWAVHGAPDVATALSTDDKTSWVERVISNNFPIGPSLVAGNIMLTNFPAFTGFAGSTSVTIQGIEVTVRARFVSRDGLAHNASIAVQPIHGSSLAAGSAPIQQTIFYDNTAPTQPDVYLTFGGPKNLFGMTADNIKAIMDTDFGFAVQPWVTSTAGNRIGEVDVFYVTAKVYYTVTVSGYYFWNGTDDVTGKVTNYNVESGTWEKGDAKGTMQIIDVVPVGSGNRRAIMAGDEMWTEPQGKGLKIADIDSNMSMAGLDPLQVLLENKSRYEIITANFYPNAEWEAFYGVSGGSSAFSYDGFYFKRIYGVPDPTIDKPRHIAFHQFHLALGYPSGSVELSASGDPFNFNGVDGAVEIGVGDPVTGLVRMNGTTLGVFCEKSIHGIVGTSADNFSRQILSPYEGAIEYTLLDMGHPVYCSYRGMSIFDQTAAYGDFSGSRLSIQVSPWLLPRIQGTISPLGEVAASSGPVVAIASRTRNQYRLYFGDGYRLTMTLVGTQQQPQFTIQAEGLYDTIDAGFDFNAWMVPRAEASFVDETGAERIFIAHYSSAKVPPGGKYYVYEYDRSWTFDGAGIPSYFVSNENFYGSTFDWEKIEKIRLHGMSLGYAPINVHVETNYFENTSTPQKVNLAAPVNLPRNPQPSLSNDYANFSNICNVARDGRSFNFRFMSYRLDGQPTDVKDPVYADVSPPFVAQAMLVQIKEGKGDV